jgi:hypothetical protein
LGEEVVMISLLTMKQDDVFTLNEIQLFELAHDHNVSLLCKGITDSGKTIDMQRPISDIAHNLECIRAKLEEENE